MNIGTKFGAICALAACVTGTRAAVVVLDFEGIGDQVAVGEFYNGAGGPDYNVSFGPNALALEFGNFSNNPSGTAIMFFLTGSAVMNIPSGFDTGFSFFYASNSQTPAVVNIYDDVDGGGNLLGSFPLPTTTAPYTVWEPVGVAFSGIAKSVDFVGAPNFIGFDNITFGDSVPEGAVPEPSTVIGGLALAGLAGSRLLRRKQA